MCIRDSFNTAFSGDVPLGAGMSSSAALESCYATAINELFGEKKIEKMERAKDVYKRQPYRYDVLE